MAEVAEVDCDLCEEPHCAGPTTYAHKPYIFHFYHATQYKQALLDFQALHRQREEEEEEGEYAGDDVGEDVEEEDVEDSEEELLDDDLIINDLNPEIYEQEFVEDEGEDEDDDENEDEEDISEDEYVDRDEYTVDGNNNNEKEGVVDNSRTIGDFVSNKNDEIFTAVNAVLEEKRISTSEDNELLNSSEEYANNDADASGELMVKVYDENGEVLDESSEIGTDGEEEYEEYEEGEKLTTDQGYKNAVLDTLSTSSITSVVTETKTVIGKTLDFTMAAGVGIMAAIASVVSEKDLRLHHAEPSASIMDLGTTTKTSIGVVLAVTGMLGGIKEIINAITETPPPLPVCERCQQCELELPGCQTFCENCGECDHAYWKAGNGDMHCLKICNSCSVNCVLCEASIATVKKHHKAFTTEVHRGVTTRLYGTCKNARIFGSSLLIAGIMTCVLPGISWSWGVALVAGSVITNSGARIIARPVVRMRCDSCEVETSPEEFHQTKGCQRWCMCCGVQDSDGGECERFCLALCEQCYDD